RSSPASGNPIPSCSKFTEGWRQQASPSALRPMLKPWGCGFPYPFTVLEKSTSSPYSTLSPSARGPKKRCERASAFIAQSANPSTTVYGSALPTAGTPMPASHFLNSSALPSKSALILAGATCFILKTPNALLQHGRNACAPEGYGISSIDSAALTV